MADNGADTVDEGPNGVFVLPRKLTIALTADYFQRLLSRVEQGEAFALDGSAVERIDAAGIQLLLVVQRMLMETHQSLRWTAISDAFRESVDLLGLTEQLALPAER